MSHLEKYLRVCACHRVGVESEWVKLEEFMARKFETRTSHGICEDYLKRQRAALAEMNDKQPLLPLPDLPTPRRAH